mmetsp:Transcript_37384/g.75452  ORF Transcript_37384/g.75452 Transcript_37384/m.75452 type:complete len:221 (-) Transcript_37384:211-873(-)
MRLQGPDLLHLQDPPSSRAGVHLLRDAAVGCPGARGEVHARARADPAEERAAQRQRRQSVLRRRGEGGLEAGRPLGPLRESHHRAVDRLLQHAAQGRLPLQGDVQARDRRLRDARRPGPRGAAAGHEGLRLRRLPHARRHGPPLPRDRRAAGVLGRQLRLAAERRAVLPPHRAQRLLRPPGSRHQLRGGQGNSMDERDRATLRHADQRIAGRPCRRDLTI